MIIRSLIRSLIAMAVLLAALTACKAAATPPADPVRDELAIQPGEGHWVAAVQTHGLERAFRAAAQE